MNDRIKIRANRSTGELEVEGEPQAVAEWWDKLWPVLNENRAVAVAATSIPRQALDTSAELPGLFGEFYSHFRSSITDVDKVLVAGAFVQGKDSDRCFTTKAANQLLID